VVKEFWQKAASHFVPFFCIYTVAETPNGLKIGLLLLKLFMIKNQACCSLRHSVYWSTLMCHRNRRRRLQFHRGRLWWRGLAMWSVLRRRPAERPTRGRRSTSRRQLARPPWRSDRATPEVLEDHRVVTRWRRSTRWRPRRELCHRRSTWTNLWPPSYHRLQRVLDQQQITLTVGVSTHLEPCYQLTAVCLSVHL